MGQQLLVFIAVTAFNKTGTHEILVFTKCVLPSVNNNKNYYFFSLSYARSGVMQMWIQELLKIF